VRSENAHSKAGLLAYPELHTALGENNSSHVTESLPDRHKPVTGGLQRFGHLQCAGVLAGRANLELTSTVPIPADL